VNALARFGGGVAKGVARPLFSNPTAAKTLAGKAGDVAGRVMRRAALPVAALGAGGYFTYDAMKGGYEKARPGMSRQYLAAQNRGYVP
jgi:hypothetical protein